MKNPFKRTGFDTLISKGTTIDGLLFIDGTTIVEGCVRGSTIQEDPETKNSSTLVVNGNVNITDDIRVQNVTITGTVRCKMLIVPGVLAVKDGAQVFAELIKYGSLVVEPKAILHGMMVHNSVDTEVKADV
jgi:cytoskeletal protein CcmA (bactofilin family)